MKKYLIRLAILWNMFLLWFVVSLLSLGISRKILNRILRLMIHEKINKKGFNLDLTDGTGNVVMDYSKNPPEPKTNKKIFLSEKTYKQINGD